MIGESKSMLRLRPGRKKTFETEPHWYADPHEGFERAIVWEPGFGLDPDERDRGASARYGRSAMSIRWLLRGPKGVAQFLMSTGWTPETQTVGYSRFKEWMHTAPSGFDLGYHARVPQYEGAEQYGQQPCVYLGQDCWYDGSSLAADEVLEEFFDRGDEAIWERLRKVHDDLIGADG